MKYSPLYYALALRKVLAETRPAEHETVIKNFARTLLRHGDQAEGDKIASELEKIITEENGGRMVVLESARTLPDRELDSLKRRFRERDRISLKVNPELSAGVRITIGGERELDNTLARKLQHLFSVSNLN